MSLLDDAGVLLVLAVFLEDLAVEDGAVGGLLLAGVAVEESLVEVDWLVGDDFRDFLDDLDVCDFAGLLPDVSVSSVDMGTSGFREALTPEDCDCGA